MAGFTETTHFYAGIFAEISKGQGDKMSEQAKYEQALQAAMNDAAVSCESTGGIDSGSYSAIGDGLKSLIADRLINEIKAMVRGGIDTPEERETLSRAAVSVIEMQTGKLPDFAVAIIVQLLSGVMEQAASALEG